MFRLIDRRFNKLRKSYEKLRHRVTKSRSAAGSLQRHEIDRAGEVPSSSSDMQNLRFGLGEVFRNIIEALDSAGMPPAIYPFSKDVETLVALVLSWRADTTATVCTT
jgi:hypothetical protein